MTAVQVPSEIQQPRTRSAHYRGTEFVVAGFSLANLCYARIWSILLTRHGREAFFAGASAIDLYAFLLALCLSGFAIAILLWLGRSRNRFVAVPAMMSVLILVLIPANEMRRLALAPHLMIAMTEGITHAVPHFARLALLLLVALIFVWVTVRFVERIATFILKLAVIISPLLFFSAGRAIWDLARNDVDQPFVAAPARTALDDFHGRRVVVIVFDEMDFGFAFDRRPPGLDLPNFDQLRARSFFADSALPPSMATLFSLPSYITGSAIRAAEPASPNDLNLHPAGTVAPQLWSRTPGFLNHIHDSGGQTSLVGFSIPYCRVLRAALSRCAYWPLSGTSGQRPLGKIMLSHLAQIAPVGLHVRWRELYELVEERSLREVADPENDLIFLHVPTPHPPGIYDFRTHRFLLFAPDYARGYFGNLALADVFLGKVERALSASKLANSTSLIVTSDHAWRESKRFTGRSDTRVPFLVSLPGQTAPDRFSTRMYTLSVGTLATSLLKGEVRDSSGLRSWVAQHASAPTP